MPYVMVHNAPPPHDCGLPTGASCRPGSVAVCPRCGVEWVRYLGWWEGRLSWARHCWLRQSTGDGVETLSGRVLFTFVSLLAGIVSSRLLLDASWSTIVYWSTVWVVGGIGGGIVRLVCAWRRNVYRYRPEGDELAEQIGRLS